MMSSPFNAEIECALAYPISAMPTHADVLRAALGLATPAEPEWLVYDATEDGQMFRAEGMSDLPDFMLRCMASMVGPVLGRPVPMQLSWDRLTGVIRWTTPERHMTGADGRVQQELIVAFATYGRTIAAEWEPTCVYIGTEFIALTEVASTTCFRGAGLDLERAFSSAYAHELATWYNDVYAGRYDDEERGSEERT